MNTYLLAMREWFSIESKFEIDANTKAEALEKFKKTREYASDAYDHSSLRVVKKINKKDGK